MAKANDTVATVKKAIGKRAQPLKAIAEKAGLSVESTRTAVAKLRADGTVRMDGNKRTAVYALA